MKIIKSLFLFICISGFAQSKVGTIDIDVVLSQMPELAGLQKQVEDYAKELDAGFDKKMANYNTLVKAYTDSEAGFTETIKKQKQEEIIASENDLGKYQQNGSKLINIKRDELAGPLYKKIGVALEKVAQAERYTQVLQINETIVYLDNGYDLTLKVLKELGIEVKPE